MLSLINLKLFRSVKGFSQILFASPIPTLFKSILTDLKPYKHQEELMSSKEESLEVCICWRKHVRYPSYVHQDYSSSPSSTLLLQPLCCSLWYPSHSYGISSFWMQTTVLSFSAGNRPALSFVNLKESCGLSWLRGMLGLVGDPCTFPP